MHIVFDQPLRNQLEARGKPKDVSSQAVSILISIYIYIYFLYTCLTGGIWSCAELASPAECSAPEDSKPWAGVIFAYPISMFPFQHIINSWFGPTTWSYLHKYFWAWWFRIWLTNVIQSCPWTSASSFWSDFIMVCRPAIHLSPRIQWRLGMMLMSMTKRP